MKKIKHWLAHLFMLNHGDCYSWWDGNKLMMGYRCRGCETIQGVHIAKIMSEDTQ